MKSKKLTQAQKISAMEPAVEQMAHNQGRLHHQLQAMLMVLRAMPGYDETIAKLKAEEEKPKSDLKN